MTLADPKRRSTSRELRIATMEKKAKETVIVQ